MNKIKLQIQSGNRLFEPPIESGVKIEWERTSTPGKLTFTTVKVTNVNMSFFEGDQVRFYYEDRLIFVGYIFTKKRDREHRIQVTCYDQLRYFKNKFAYVFENKTASQIVAALCKDFNLQVGTIDDTKYIIPTIAEENKSAFDISLTVLQETLMNTGEMFILYDDCGKITVRNSANMVTNQLIFEETAENFDYSSSIDSDTYNSVILYYKKEDELVQVYTASSPTTISQWGTLRYFEEVKNPTIGQSKANALLKLYNKKTRELKITGAFGDTSVRGGTLIPVKLVVGDKLVNNYMLVDSVTHNFENDHYSMDLTVSGDWNDGSYDVVSKTYGSIPTNSVNGDGSITTEELSLITGEKGTLTIYLNRIGSDKNLGVINVSYIYDGVRGESEYDISQSRYEKISEIPIEFDIGTSVIVTSKTVSDGTNKWYSVITSDFGNVSGDIATSQTWNSGSMSKNCQITIGWNKLTERLLIEKMLKETVGMNIHTKFISMNWLCSYNITISYSYKGKQYDQTFADDKYESDITIRVDKGTSATVKFDKVVHYVSDDLSEELYADIQLSGMDSNWTRINPNSMFSIDYMFNATANSNIAVTYDVHAS